MTMEFEAAGMSSIMNSELHAVNDLSDLTAQHVTTLTNATRIAGHFSCKYEFATLQSTRVLYEKKKSHL